MAINTPGKDVCCDPTISLASYIRDHVGLKGTKVQCEEGGCGACVVNVSERHPGSGKVTTRAINACLCPVQGVVGCHVTTVEGIGNQHSGFHEIQKSIAEENGSQCGYCTPGVVGSVYGLLCNQPDASPSDVERCLDGNLCRCTGYGAILDGAKKAAHCKGPVVDIEDLELQCLTPLPPHQHGGVTWVRPTTVAGVLQAFSGNRGKDVKLVFGNTGSGFYRTKLRADVIVDLKQVNELYVRKVSSESVEFGANFTIQELIEEFAKLSSELGSESGGKFQYLAKVVAPLLSKVASRPVRNAGSWAGNLVLRHKDPSFVSDLFTVLEGLQATITLASNSGRHTCSPREFLGVDMAGRLVTSVSLPGLHHQQERLQAFKFMPRAANSLAILNAAMYVKMGDGKISAARFVFGGFGQTFVRAEKTEKCVTGRVFNKALVKECLEVFTKECKETDYKVVTARNLLFLFMQNACDPKVSAEDFYKNTCDEFVPSTRHYEYEEKTEMYPLCQPMPKTDALLQCSGEAQYVNDRPTVEGELQAYCVLSTQARAKIDSVDTGTAMMQPGVVLVVQACDIVGKNAFKVDVATKEPIRFLADGRVDYAGQPIAIVLAETYEAAKLGAEAVYVTYSEILTPVLELSEAIEKDYRHGKDLIADLGEAKQKDYSYGKDPNFELLLTRGDAAGSLSVHAASDHVITGEVELRLAPHHSKLNVVTRGDAAGSLSAQAASGRVITGEVELKSQYHYYLENQACLIVPYDDMLNVWVTSQGPSQAQIAVADATGRQMARPVRLVWSLEHCMKIQGKRIPCVAKYKVAYTAEGKVEAIDLDFYDDCGAYCDPHACLIIDEAMRNIENVYHVPNWSMRGHAMKTDKPFNTAMRGPLFVNAVYVMESIMEHISFKLNRDPVEIKRNNLLKNGDPTLFGGVFVRETISQLWRDLAETSKLTQWKQEIELFNAASGFRKRGLAVVPSRSRFFYGNWFSFSAYVTIYAHDGTVGITHGGVEMGSGKNTKIMQTAARCLGVDILLIKSFPTMSLTSANNGFDAGCVPTEAICRSVTECCDVLNRRLSPIKVQNPGASWQEVVQKGNDCGIQLTATAKHLDPDPFPYSTYGICALEVEVSLLTGTYIINKMDTIFDASGFRKRGLAVVPSRSRFFYGNWFSFSAYVTIYAHDGTVGITHGGVEMGSGKNTKIMQTAARCLGVDILLIKSFPTMSLTSANNGFDAGCVPTEAICRSVTECCDVLNRRLSPIKVQNPGASWQEVVQKGNDCGIQLTATAKHLDPDPFPYSTYGICALEVEVSLLTGTYIINKMDTIFDVGESLNPLLDIGQIEGAISMSLGYFSSEQEKYDPKSGVLLTNGTWDYKPPTALDAPKNMNIRLMKGGYNYRGMMSNKAIGEPPISCGSVLLFALHNAVHSFRMDKKIMDYFTINQPATPEEVMRSCPVSIDDLVNTL